MPARRTRTRGRRENIAVLESWQEFGLQNGPMFDQTDELLQELWEVHREAVLEAWILKDPGTRPWAWWEFDAPEPRRELNPPPIGALTECGDEGRRCPGRIFVGNTELHDLVPWMEEERDYLDRLGLLGDDERIALEDLPLPKPGTVVLSEGYQGPMWPEDEE